ncbi:uncharacterized protein LY89DRAFT_566485, partial [Mollisia scopiformis]
KDVYTYYGTTRWDNHDLYPIPKKERTFGVMAFFAYWITTGVSVGTFTLGSTYIALGLNAGETLGAILGGCILSDIVGCLCGKPGQDYSIGYTLMNRATFGLWGTCLPITVVGLGGIVYSGIQSYYGGEAFTLVLGAIFPSFHRMKNTLPANAAITTQNLIGFICFIAVYIPILWFVPLHQIRKGLYPSFIMICACFIGLLAWALHANGGTGSLISSPIVLTKTQKAFRIVQCLSTVSGSWGGAGERYSDWSRFERRKNTAFLAMAVALPITITITGLIGVLVTTATTEMNGGVIQWNPLLLLISIQQETYTPLSRCATFFAGIAILSSQIFVNLTQNTIPYGMDLAGMFPRYLSRKRACMILRTWGQKSVRSGFYIATSTGILIADYWIVRKRLWNVPDLYVEDGIYWYTGGWNLRAVVSLFVGMIPGLPGFFMTVIGSNPDSAAVKIFQVYYCVGFPLGVLTYLAAYHLFPPAGLGVKVLME